MGDLSNFPPLVPKATSGATTGSHRAAVDTGGGVVRLDPLLWQTSPGRRIANTWLTVLPTHTHHKAGRTLGETTVRRETGEGTV